MHLDGVGRIRQGEIHRPKGRLITFGILISLIHTLLLLVIIPLFSARLASSYNQNEFADGYDYLASNLDAGYGYRFYPDTARTLMREPGYPILLAGLFLLFGKAFIAVKVVNLLFALTTAWLITRVMRRLSSDEWPMMAAVSLYLFHPGTLIAESRGGVEILFECLIVLFILTFLNAKERDKLTGYVVSGLVLGIALLVRSVLLLFPVFLLGYLIIFERKRISKIVACRNIGVMVLAMFAALSPWIVRNYSLTGKFVPTASVLGVSAQAGQYISSHLSEGKPWWLLDREAGHERSRLAIALGLPFEDGSNGYYQTFYRTKDEILFSNYLFRRVVDGYEKSPGLFVSVVGHNLFNFWFTGKTQAITYANIIVQAPYMLLAIFGLVIGIRNRQAVVIGPIVLLIGYMMAVSVPILAQARYSVPLVPFLSILGTISLMGAWKKVKNTRGSAVTYLEDNMSSELASCPPAAQNDTSAVPVPFSSAVIEEVRSHVGQLGRMVALRPADQTNIYLSIVIPTYNEQARLPRTMVQTLQYCATENLEFEIIIADDGSRDDTLALAQIFEESDTRIRALSCPHMGKGAAVRMGMLNAKGRFVLFMDADGATPLNQLPKLLAAVEAGSDVAVGSRALEGTEKVEIKTSIHRRLMGRLFAFFVSLFAIEGIADTQCGFKLFRREAAQAIFALQKLPGFAFDVEILLIAERLSFSVTEIPVNWIAQPGSKVNLIKDSIKMLWDISLIRWVHRHLGTSGSAPQYGSVASKNGNENSTDAAGIRSA